MTLARAKSLTGASLSLLLDQTLLYLFYGLGGGVTKQSLVERQHVRAVAAP